MDRLYGRESRAWLRMPQRVSHIIHETLGLPELFRSIRKNSDGLNLQVE